MSIEAMTAVWKSNLYSSGTLLVLLAMADYANEEWTCRPSVTTLSQKSRLSARQVQRILRTMEADGVITSVGEYPTQRGSAIVIYRINAGALVAKGDISVTRGDNLSPIDTPETGQRVTSATPKGDTHVAYRVTPMSYDPSLDPPIDPSGEELAAALPPAPPPAAAAPTVLDEQRTTTARTLVQQPAVVVYRDVFLAYPSRAQMTQIAAHGIGDMRRWGAVVAEWCKRGYNPRNIGGMLDWYDNPERMETNGRSTSQGRASPARSKVAASMQAIDDVMAMIERGEST